jgi:hypothetical protein
MLYFTLNLSFTLANNSVVEKVGVSYAAPFFLKPSYRPHWLNGSLFKTHLCLTTNHPNSIHLRNLGPKRFMHASLV